MLKCNLIFELTVSTNPKFLVCKLYEILVNYSARFYYKTTGNNMYNNVLDDRTFIFGVCSLYLVLNLLIP